jgi:hypothetical protein
MGARSYYDVLGVSPRAGADELRRAYLTCAREAHPDRHVDAGVAERSSAEVRIREVNEAWAVLGNPRRRRRYDLERRPRDVDQSPFVTRSDGTMPPSVNFDGVDPTARLIRGLPWLVLVVVMFAIFIFTAYAATGGGKSSPAPTNNLARCVVVAPGPVVSPAACGTDGSRLVIATVAPTEPCPAGSERLQPASGPSVYCLEV